MKVCDTLISGMKQFLCQVHLMKKSKNYFPYSRRLWPKDGIFNKALVMRGGCKHGNEIQVVKLSIVLSGELYYDDIYDNIVLVLLGSEGFAYK
jgi:hypothetical protein